MSHSNFPAVNFMSQMDLIFFQQLAQKNSEIKREIKTSFLFSVGLRVIEVDFQRKCKIFVTNVIH